MANKNKRKRKNPTSGRDHYFIIVGNGKPIPVVGRTLALNKAWEMSEKTNKTIRVVKLVAKFKSGAKLNRFTQRPVLKKKKKLRRKHK